MERIKFIILFAVAYKRSKWQIKQKLFTCEQYCFFSQLTPCHFSPSVDKSMDWAGVSWAAPLRSPGIQWIQAVVMNFVRPAGSFITLDPSCTPLHSFQPCPLLYRLSCWWGQPDIKQLHVDTTWQNFPLGLGPGQLPSCFPLSLLWLLAHSTQGV